METAYDWITIGIFAALIVLFMQRSTSDLEPGADPIWKYLVAGVGCGVSNYLGNSEWHLPAILMIIGTIAFTFYSLQPFSTGHPR